jgi:hypothetical protein
MKIESALAEGNEALRSAKAIKQRSFLSEKDCCNAFPRKIKGKECNSPKRDRQTAGSHPEQNEGSVPAV